MISANSSRTGIGPGLWWTGRAGPIWERNWDNKQVYWEALHNCEVQASGLEPRTDRSQARGALLHPPLHHHGGHESRGSRVDFHQHHLCSPRRDAYTYSFESSSEEQFGSYHREECAALGSVGVISATATTPDLRTIQISLHYPQTVTLSRGPTSAAWAAVKSYAEEILGPYAVNVISALPAARRCVPLPATCQRRPNWGLLAPLIPPMWKLWCPRGSFDGGRAARGQGDGE
ncbi:hyaluronidase-1-like isoform X1 [Lates japonicus]|uniref:Hyaluronidase-1-like isoform X1 n=1 Tax=Lates japonicus TaxID=270547 RepID=A0AAD3ME32_LATJO|nr:hyaluronidase-1-like isoform X1 [Lates japonicus]